MITVDAQLLRMMQKTRRSYSTSDHEHSHVVFILFNLTNFTLR